MKSAMMSDLDKQKKDPFFNKYFVNSKSTVRIFSGISDLYFEKAYSEFLVGNPAVIDAAAAIDGAVPIDMTVVSIAESVMNWFYTLSNGVIAVLSLLKNMLLPTFILSVAWNLIDSLGAFIIAAKEGENHDSWSLGINIISGIQLLTGTIASLLLNPDIIYIGIHASLGLSAIAAGASSFAFAAAMFFSWALEHREVKLHQERIVNLDSKIKELEATLFQSGNNYLGAKYKGANNTEQKIVELKKINDNVLLGSIPEGYNDLLRLLEFHQHQTQQLAIHERARQSWSLCAVFMTAVAIVSVTVIALGLSAATCGIAVAAVSFAAFLGSALYRNKPEVDEMVKTIKNNRASFFKSQSQPASCRSEDIPFWPRQAF